MKPICVPCRRFFRMVRSGVAFEEGMPTTDAVGTPTWKPYKLWLGDLWRCPTCKAETISGVGGGPVAEHFQSDYALAVQTLRPLVRVDDC
jgi:hypothetical protein